MRETDDYYFFWEHQFGQWTKRDITDTDEPNAPEMNGWGCRVVTRDRGFDRLISVLTCLI